MSPRLADVAKASEEGARAYSTNGSHSNELVVVVVSFAITLWSNKR